MENQTHETTPRMFVEAEGIRFVYRGFGKAEGDPFVFLQYFTANRPSLMALPSHLASAQLIVYPESSHGAHCD